MASISQPAQLLQALKFTRGDLSIKIGETWQRLASPTGDNKFNCHNVVFDDGITVSQVDKTTGGICTIKFSVETPATIVLDEADRHRPLSVEAKCREIGELEMDCSKPEKAPGIEDARRFALANLDRTTAVIKLAGLTVGNSNRKALAPQAISPQIAALLVRKARGTAANDAGVFLRELFDVSMAERDHQVEKVMQQTGCRVVLQKNARGTQLELRAWPGVDPDARDVDILTNDMPMRFAVAGHPLLTRDELPAHPIIGQETDDWEINVIKSSAAPVVGIIANSFLKLGDMDNFIGEASGITLVPIIDDILGTRSRKAMRELEMSSADQEGLDTGEISRYLDPKGSLSALPLESLFLVARPVPEKSEIAIQVPKPPILWNEGLKERQRVAVQNAITNCLFAVHGPPGTGKSQVASRILWCLLSMFGDRKVLCSAPANVALESLLRRCIKECKDLGMKELPFVRIWSVAQTKAQYSNGDYAVLDEPYHIEALRVKKARINPIRFAAYLQGHEKLRELGVIDNIKLHQDWDKTTKILTRMVMNEARAAFCTTAALSSPALKWKEGGETKTWPAGTWLLDEAGQANPDVVLLGLVTFASTLTHFTMLGDHCQLAAYKGSSLAKRVRTKPFLEQYVDRKFPYVLLNHQFRALDVCMWPVNRVVYGGQIVSEYNRVEPGPLGPAVSLLQSMLPVSLIAGNRQYDITTLHNFVDVASGQHFVPEGGSSPGNYEEVAVVSALVQSLKGGGIPSSQICVFAAYRTQVKLLEEEATQAQWRGCFINTIDKGQGQEFLVVIISLVKTEGDAGFIEEVGRACVACSRHKIALYLVGSWNFWASKRAHGYSTMSKIIGQMKWTSGPNRDLPELVVRGKNVSSTAQPPTQQQPLEVRQQVSSSPQQPVSPRQQPASPRQQIASSRRQTLPSIQQTLSSPPPSAKLTPSPASQSQNDDWEREKQRHRERLARELEHLEIEQRRQCEKTREASNARKAAAIAALNAYHDEMLQEELAGLPIETDIEEARRALEDWN